MIKTSVVVPVYNTAQYLGECFDSIYKQSQKEIEVIAINDGSEDDSLYLLEQIKKKHPDLVIFSQENKGLGCARNKGMELASGEFLYFMDSDDCLADDALETCYQYAKKNQLDVVMFDAEPFGDIKCDTGYYNRAETISAQAVVLSGESFAEKYWLKAFVPSACLHYASAQFLKTHDLQFLPKIYYEDNEFHCRMLPLAGRVMYIPRAFYRRRYRSCSITTGQFDLRHAKDYLEMIQAVKAHSYSPELSFVMHELQVKFLTTLYVKCAEGNLLKDAQLVQEMYDTALDICGEDIRAAGRFPEINVLYQIGMALPDSCVSKERKSRIEQKRKEVLEEIFMEIPLKSKEKYVGIYGTGKHTADFLDAYEKSAGSINATMIFIDSKMASKEKKFRNFHIFNIDDIGNLPLECIVIASAKYESEMEQAVKDKYGDKFKIIRLKTDLLF